eukprot:2693339-Rhodomonas_salina.1
MACTVGKPDMSRVKVIESLHAKAGFTAEDGWTYQWWTKVLPIKLPKKKDTAEQYMMTHFKRPYLIHSDGTLVTCQKKAWMDTAGICMWVELVLKQWLDKNECPEWGSILTWDNCGLHLTRAVLDTLKECKIFGECLPKTMTDWLQVMDLVVNGPYKSHTRRLRCEDLRAYMQDFRMRFYRSKARNEPVPVWNPPKPTITEGLLNSLKACARMANDEKFKEGMRKAFVQTGVVPLSGTVVDPSSDLHFCRWTGADLQGTLAARAVGKLVGLLKLQEQEM